MKLPVAILAGGLATRLHPLTETIPKALVEVAGKPFILRQLDYLRRQGVSRVVLCVGFLGEQIDDRTEGRAPIGLPTVPVRSSTPKINAAALFIVVIRNSVSIEITPTSRLAKTVSM